MQPKVMLYALSTCIHCKNAKKFLEDNGVEYDFIYVDKLEGDERKATIELIKAHNAACSFPTILLDDGQRVIIGFKRDELKEALGI
ncbi:glutaredoxin family protein [Megalodesulfovibrio paquesii]